MFKVVIAGILLLTASQSFSDEADQYLEFFQNYRELGQDYDVAVANLYADDAQIIAIRKMPDGIEQTMKIDGARWKTMIADTMEIGKQRGDRSDFSEIKITVHSDSAKITAHRYSALKCLVDQKYYMILKKQLGGEIKIVEEYMEIAITSACENVPENDLALLLQAATKYLSSHLPLQVDPDTRLETVSSRGNTLHLEYVLINHSSSEIDTEVFAENIRPLAIQQTCAMPNFKPILDQGGTVAFKHLDKDGLELTNVEADKGSCN